MRYSFVIILFLMHSYAFAQLRFESEYDNDRNVTIYAINPDVIPYTLVIDFTTLSNLTSSGGKTVIAISSPGRNVVAKLKRTEPDQAISYKYSTRQFRGTYLAKSKEEPIYLIPVQDAQTVRAQPMTHLENVYNKEAANKTYVGTAFYLEAPTAICAPRKGIVSDMDMSNKLSGSNLSFTAKDNFIELYHEDGTFTRLMVLAANSEQVKIGDTVLPGQILASSAGEHYESGRHVRMVQRRLIKDKSEISQVQVPVKIWGNNQELYSSQAYTTVQVSHPQDLIAKELSKKELKRLQ
jgi:hypothetical protein